MCWPGKHYRVFAAHSNCAAEAVEFPYNQITVLCPLLAAPRAPPATLYAQAISERRKGPLRRE